MAAMHLLVVGRAKASNGGDERRMDWQLGGNVVLARRILTEVLLQLELSLQKLLALFF